MVGEGGEINPGASDGERIKIMASYFPKFSAPSVNNDDALNTHL